MSAPNYDSSQVGVPYTRTVRFCVTLPDNGRLPVLTIEQAEAVRMADGAARHLATLPVIDAELNTASAEGLAETFALVHPDTGASLGKAVTLLEVMMGVSAVLRKKQLQASLPAT